MNKSILFIILFCISTMTLAEKIKDFSLPIYGSNKVFNLSKELKKKKVVLNFWASWCTSCVKELPILEELKNKNPDVLFVGVNAGDSKRKIKKFLKRYSFSYLILEDKSKEFSKSVGVLNLPQTWVISNDRVVKYKSDIPPEKI